MQRDRDLFQWPTFAPRVERDGHRRAGAERGQKKIVGRRPGIGPAGSDRFVALETVRPDFNFLSKSCSAAADNYMRRIVRSIGGHRSSHSLYSLRNVIPIPFPSFAIVRRKGLAPNRTVFV